MTSFPNLACAPRLSQGGDKWHKRELLVLLGLLDQAQHYLWTSRPKLTLHGRKIQGPNLFYLAQIQGLNYSKLF